MKKASVVVFVVGLLLTVCGVVATSAGQENAQARKDLAQVIADPTNDPSIKAAGPDRQLLVQAGTGGAVTEPNFTVAGPWSVAWTYDCRKSEDGLSEHNFIIEPETGGTKMPVGLVNELGQVGSGTTSMTHGGRDVWLNIDTGADCDWHVTVIGAPGK